MRISDWSSDVCSSDLFLLGAGYTLLRNEHIRIDVVYGFWSRRTQIWIEVFGTIVFLLPMAILIGWLGWPMFAESFVRGEMSGNAGGLVRWPVQIGRACRRERVCQYVEIPGRAVQ